MENITEFIKNLDIYAIGFLDLPGELRNQIYSCVLDNQSIYGDASNVAIIHPRIRAELHSLLLNLGNLRLKFNELNTFLDDFYSPTEIVHMKNITFALPMDLKFYLNEDATTIDNRPIDMIRLASIVRQCPNLSFSTVCRGRISTGIPYLINLFRSNDDWANPHTCISKLELDRGWKWGGIEPNSWCTFRAGLVMRLILKEVNEAEKAQEYSQDFCDGPYRTVFEMAKEALNIGLDSDGRLYVRPLRANDGGTVRTLQYGRVYYLYGL